MYKLRFNKLLNNAIELKDIDLEKVNGGYIDWKEFGLKFMEALQNGTDTITVEHQQLVEAIKNKNYIEVASMSISLFSKDDPIVKKILLEYLK